MSVPFVPFERYAPVDKTLNQVLESGFSTTNGARITFPSTSVAWTQYMKFALSERNDENIRFVNEVARLNELKKSGTLNIADVKTLYDQYVPQNAPDQVNLKTDSRDAAKSDDLESFNKAASEIIQLVSRDAWKRFEKSPEYYTEDVKKELQENAAKETARREEKEKALAAEKEKALAAKKEKEIAEAKRTASEKMQQAAESNKSHKKFADPALKDELNKNKNLSKSSKSKKITGIDPPASHQNKAAPPSRRGSVSTIGNAFIKRFNTLLGLGSKQEAPSSTASTAVPSTPSESALSGKLSAVETQHANVAKMDIPGPKKPVTPITPQMNLAVHQQQTEPKVGKELKPNEMPKETRTRRGNVEATQPEVGELSQEELDKTPRRPRGGSGGPG